MNAFLDWLPDSGIYPITDRQISGLSHTQQIVKLASTGMKVVQFREKVLSPRDFYLEAEAAVRVAHERGIKIIINDRVDIALAVGADGVHLGQDDLPPEEARRLLGQRHIIGFSTHNPQQAELAVKLPIDYVAIGPIFSTTTKVTDNPLLGLSGVRQVREIVGKLPLVAIGGITLQNSAEVRRAGADATAIISDLWQRS